MYKCNMRKQDWIFLGKTSEFRLKYNTEDLLLDDDLLKKFLKESKRNLKLWDFICYHSPLWKFVKL